MKNKYKKIFVNISHCKHFFVTSQISVDLLDFRFSSDYQKSLKSNPCVIVYIFKNN